MKTKLCAILGLAVSCVSMQAANYYVNDSSTNGDVFCSAPGAVANSGTSSNAPKASLQAVLDAYTLAPGDTVFVDSGSYSNTIAATVGTADSGDATLGKVTIKGAGSAKTLLVATNNGAYGIYFSGANYVRLEGVAIRSAGQGVRIENSSHIEVVSCELASNGYGVLLSGGSDHRVESCAIHHNAHQGVVGSYSSSPVITGNLIYSQASSSDGHGIDLTYNCNSAQITGNTITNNAARGITIYSCSSPLLQNNTISANIADAIYLQSCSSASVQNQTVWLNANGLRAYSSPALTLTGSRIYSNTGYGVYVESGSVSALNNLIYANGGQGFALASSPSSTIENNTFYRNGSVNLRLAGTHSGVRVANNIISAAGATQTCIQFDTIGTSWFADYNDYFITNGAVLWNWKGPRYSLSALQTYSGNERHSIDRDPLFVNPAGADNVLGGTGGADDNFHLAVNSPALDAGDPASNFSLEPAPNGSRINLGNFGGTTQADTSGNQRVVRLLSPNGGEITFRRVWVRWAATGPWATNDMVKIEYSSNSGSTWTTAASAGALNSANGFYGWDLTSITPGVAYLVRVSSVDQPSITDSSGAMFEIQGPGAKTIYVNDSSTANDTWCSAAGAATNTGLAASSPLDSFQSVIEKYPAIGASDEIRMDTGVFDAGRTVYLNQQNSGAAGSPLVIRGSTSGAAVFDRVDQGDDAVWFDSMSWVTFDRINFARGATGLHVTGTGLNPSVGIVIKNCQAYTNSSYGIVVSTCTNLLVTGCSACRNSSAGYSLSAGGATVTNNFAGWNSGSGLGFGGFGVVAFNQCASNNATGLGASWNQQMTLVVSSNQVHHNAGTGLWIGGDCYGCVGSPQAIGNTSYANTGAGLVGNRCGGLIGNLVYSNSGDGIVSEYASHVTKNVVSDNKGNGIIYGLVVTNNLVVRNGANANYYNIALPPGGVCKNNTLVGSNGVYVADSGCTVANNIFWTRGVGMTAIYIANPGGGVTSDYNDIYATDGAIAGNWFGPRTTLASWQQVSLLDAHSISIDPRFVDNTNNFHLRSTAGSYRGAAFTAPGGGAFVNDADVSFCIDAGNPADGYALESSPNGGRIDLGAFGNNPDASHSPAARFTLLVDPQPGVKWFGTRTITWLTRGPWVAGDLVKLEFSADGGASWTNLAASVDFALGRFDWTTTGLPPGTNYFVRISKTDGTAVNVTAGAFEISASGPRTYFVNDTNTLNDVFCSAPGNAANDGLSAATPKDSIQGILDAYKVVGGDTIKVDTGNYLLAATIVMTTNNVGDAGNPIVILGSPNGTIINRQNTSYDGLYLQGAEYVRFQNLKFTGARNGLAGDGNSSQSLRGIEIVGCETMTNGTHGFNFSYTSNLVISASSMHHNGYRGANLGSAVQVIIASNTTCFNQEGLWVDSSGIVSGNLCFSNSSRGLGMSGTILVSGNTSWRNSVGIQGWPQLTVTNNLVYNNTYEGIHVYYSANEVTFNRVFGNGGTGIYLEGGKARRNVVFSNGGNGIQGGGSGEEIRNNLVYGNSSWNVYVDGTGCATLLENNTLYGGNGLSLGFCCSGAKWFTNRNNIIWATGTNKVAIEIRNWPDLIVSDNNNYYVTDGAAVGRWLGKQSTLLDWQYFVKLDSHSFSADPLFVNPAGADGVLGGTNGWDDNFHLMSVVGSYRGAAFTATAASAFTPDAQTSACVDAGPASAPVGDEVAPNGGRQDMGAFGGTADASLSPGVAGISILNIAAGNSLRGVKTVFWVTRGPWAAGETLRLDYSTNGGTNWTTASGLNAVPNNAVSLDWDTSSLTPGTNYTVRLIGNTNGAASVVGPVAIIANAPVNFYVNDANPTNDVYCTAIGNDNNSGLTPATPKATLKGLFRDYKLIAGDRVWIDTGWWTLDSAVQFMDSGSVAGKIRFIGSTHPAGSWFDRVDNQQNAFLVSSSDNISLENLKFTRSYDAIHIEGTGSDLCDGVQVLGCELATNYHYTIYFSYATNLMIANCDIHDNYLNGILGGGYGVIRSNRVYRTTAHEAILVWGGPLLVEGNQVYQNSSCGIYGTTLVTCKGNTVFSNNSDGIYLEGGAANLSEAIENRVFLNGGIGLVVASGASAKRNVVYSNGGNGIQGGGGGEEIRNNLVYGNSSWNVYVNGNGCATLLENNTLYGGNGLSLGFCCSGAKWFTNRNNIIWATGAGKTAIEIRNWPDLIVSDNNNIVTTAGATVGRWLGRQNDLLEWRAATGLEAHSFSIDPLFVNAAGADGIIGGTNGLDDNFHLASTVGSYKGLAFTALTTVGFTADLTNSPCIDAGLPSSAVGAELDPNGGRIDLGAFGGTADASLSTGTRVVELGLIGGGGPILRGTVPINWWTHGAWQSNDTVVIEYSSNGGGSWAAIPGAAAVPFAQGVFAWDTSVLTPGSNYQVRITPNAGGTAAVSRLLRIIASTAITFYLNDSSTTNDVYCTAVGSDANDGLTPSTPMANLKRLVLTYKLMSGDTVRIDTGLWTLDANLVLTDSGAPGQLIRLVGSTNSLGSVFNRNDTGTGMYGITLNHNHYMRLENLKVTGAQHGIVIGGDSGNYSQGIELAGCEVYDNSVWGIVGSYCTNIVVSGCIARNNRHGLDVDTGSGTVSGNRVHHNTGYGLYLNGNFLASGNDCYNNSDIAFKGLSGVRAYNNLIHGNAGEPALHLDYLGSEAVSNRVYLNSGDGLYVRTAGITRRNVVYSNGGHGIVVDSWNGANTVVNNLVYDNDRSNEGHFNMFVNRNGDIIQNNTLYGGNGLYWNGPWGDVTRNNIIWARGSSHCAIYYANSSATPVSDFNNLYAPDGATLGYWGGTACSTLAAWKTTTGLDTNSLSADPLFVDPNGADDTLGGFYGVDDDFHLSSTAGSYHDGFWFADATNSPCIDAGDPSMVFTNEPYYNGLRVNLGAYGNTAEASKTAYAGAFYTLNITTNPANGGTVAVVWPPGVSNLYYPANTAVTLNATNNLGFIWGSWSGAVSSTNTSISVVVNSNTPLTANFIAVMPHVLYRLEDSFAASIGTPPDLTNINTGLNFSTATVRGAARRVLNFPYNTGLQLQPTLGVFPNQLYTIAMLFKFDAVNGYRRLLDFRNVVSPGLYVHDGRLEFYTYGSQSAVCVTNDTWHMVAITHDTAGQMNIYCDGALQLTVTDSSNYGVVSSANTLRFFKDNGSDNSGGSVSRIHIYSRVLDASEVAALNALDDAPPLITSPALTGAAQGLPFVWPVTGPAIAGILPAICHRV